VAVFWYIPRPPSFSLIYGHGGYSFTLPPLVNDFCWVGNAVSGYVLVCNPKSKSFYFNVMWINEIVKRQHATPPYPILFQILKSNLLA